MDNNGVRFSIASHAQWAPGLDTSEAWTQWTHAPYRITSHQEPAVQAMPAMLRRRAGFLGKMALEVAYACLDGRTGIPMVFCSRHGEVARAVTLLQDLIRGEALSPTAFGMSVHNAIAGMLTIARSDQANHIALAAGSSSVEHAVIEACALLADGEPMVLLVACDSPLPESFASFEDCEEQPHAWAWLMAPATPATPAAPAPPVTTDVVTLTWRASDTAPSSGMPAGLEVARFFLGAAHSMERCDGRLRWHWGRDA
jgi:hypothetical protein